jgi:hypothetical protein
MKKCRLFARHQSQVARYLVSKGIRIPRIEMPAFTSSGFVEASTSNCVLSTNPIMRAAFERDPCASRRILVIIVGIRSVEIEQRCAGSLRCVAYTRSKDRHN